MHRSLAILLLTAAAGCTSVPRDRPVRPVRAIVISDLNGAYGSTDYAPAVHHAVQAITATWRPDLVLVAGDMIAGQSTRLSDSVVVAMWQSFDSVVAAPLRAAGIPLVMTLGNHDGSAYPAYARERQLAVAHWRRVMPDAPGEHYPLRYARQFGDVFVVSWDATNQESATNDELLAWLRTTLQGDAARRARHRVVLGHLPLYAVAEGRNRAGEVLADGDALRRQLEGWGATMYVSGHHHAYYPGRRGALDLLHAGALGGGPRPLVGATTPSPKTVSLLEFLGDSVAVTTWIVDETSGTLAPLPTPALPPVICGFSGHVVRRDLAEPVQPCGR